MAMLIEDLSMTGLRCALRSRISEDAEMELPLSLYYSFCADDYDRSPLFLLNFVLDLVLSDEEGYAIFEYQKSRRSGRNQYLIDLVVGDCFGRNSDRFSEHCIVSFSGHDRDQLLSLLHVSMLSWWTVFLYSADGRTRVLLDQDSYIEVHSHISSAEIERRFTEITGQVIKALSPR